jgi:peptidoglycan/xylan/chitin deacetylase (PgdA/CDA1 family)
MKEALDLAEKNLSLQGKLVITFDDGFRENYEIAAPILVDEGVTATFYFTTGCVDNKNMMWRNKILLYQKYKGLNFASSLNDITCDYGINGIDNYDGILEWSFKEWPMCCKEEIVDRLWTSIMPMKLEDYLDEHRPYCTSTQIKELVAAGFGIGAHSVTHPILSKLEYEDFSREVTESFSDLRTITGTDLIDTFSYPFGDRADSEFEERLRSENSELRAMLGTKNSLSNYPNNSHMWERDNVEFSGEYMRMRFIVLPVYRLLMSGYNFSSK